MVENNVGNAIYLCINFNHVQGYYTISESCSPYSFAKIILKGRHINENLKVML